jgi:hypothetical protein
MAYVFIRSKDKDPSFSAKAVLANDRFPPRLGHSKCHAAMAGLGQTETNDHVSGMSALDPTPEELAHGRPCSFALILADRGQATNDCSGVDSGHSVAIRRRSLL